VVEKTGKEKGLRIAHISDIHVGSFHFVSNLLNRAIVEINEMDPDFVMVTGDLTNEGFRQQYSAVRAYLNNVECERMSVIPGNHDSRNVGYVHFEDFFGSRNNAEYLPGVTVVALDSSQPDLNEGRLGRQNYRWMAEKFSNPDDFKIVALHHHLLPLPGAGRERNIIEDAGDFLQLLVEQGVDLVLSGHKHVPHVWHFENLYVANAGTVSSLRVRGYARPCYEIVDIDADRCVVTRKFPFGESVEVVSFPKETKPPSPKTSSATERLVI
jgi:3',5'-cyclic AMP phosphodiesterase CpdA